MNCQICKKKIKLNKYAHNVKYCSAKCRNKKYQPYRTEWTRKRNDRVASKPSSKKVKCEICSKYYVQVGTHIVQRHKMTAREYRKELGFDVKRGQIPDWYRVIKSTQAIECGGVKNLKLGKKFWFKKGDKRAGKYKRSEQTLNRLKYENHARKSVS